MLVRIHLAILSHGWQVWEMISQRYQLHLEGTLR